MTASRAQPAPGLGLRPALRRSRLGIQARQRVFAYGLLLPAVASVAFLILYPLLRVVELSFREGRAMTMARIAELPLGLGNYRRVLGDPAFWNSVSVTAIYVFFSVLGAFLVGLGTALLLNERIPGRRWFRALILVPWAVPGVITSILFLWLLDGSFGVVNALLRSAGLIARDVNWFVEADTALAAVMLPTIWKAYPLITLTLLAAMQSIPESLYEAAQIDGANGWEQFLHITWPGIQGAGLLAAMITALWVFRDIDVIFAATGGGPARATETLAVYVYTEAFRYFRMGTASAVGTLMVATALAASLLAAAALRKDRFS